MEHFLILYTWVVSQAKDSLQVRQLPFIWAALLVCLCLVLASHTFNDNCSWFLRVEEKKNTIETWAVWANLNWMSPSMSSAQSYFWTTLTLVVQLKCVTDDGFWGEMPCGVESIVYLCSSVWDKRPKLINCDVTDDPQRDEWQEAAPESTVNNTFSAESLFIPVWTHRCLSREGFLFFFGLYTVALFYNEASKTHSVSCSLSLWAPSNHWPGIPVIKTLINGLVSC